MNNIVKYILLISTTGFLLFSCKTTKSNLVQRQTKLPDSPYSDSIFNLEEYYHNSTSYRARFYSRYYVFNDSVLINRRVDSLMAPKQALGVGRPMGELYSKMNVYRHTYPKETRVYSSITPSSRSRNYNASERRGSKFYRRVSRENIYYSSKGEYQQRSSKYTLWSTFFWILKHLLSHYPFSSLCVLYNNRRKKE